MLPFVIGFKVLFLKLYGIRRTVGLKSLLPLLIFTFINLNRMHISCDGQKKNEQCQFAKHL